METTEFEANLKLNLLKLKLKSYTEFSKICLRTY